VSCNDTPTCFQPMKKDLLAFLDALETTQENAQKYDVDADNESQLRALAQEVHNTVDELDRNAACVGTV
jgi:hypothetical protein